MLRVEWMRALPSRNHGAQNVKVVHHFRISGKRMFFRWGRLCGRAKFNLDPRTVPENRDEPLISYSFCAIEREEQKARSPLQIVSGNNVLPPIRLLLEKNQFWPDLMKIFSLSPSFLFLQIISLVHELYQISSLELVEESIILDNFVQVIKIRRKLKKNIRRENCSIRISLEKIILNASIVHF